MTERRQGTEGNGEDEARNEEGEERTGQAASREAVEEEERIGGPGREGDG